MIIRIILLLILFIIVKLFINKFKIFDFFNFIVTLFIIFFSTLYIFNNSKIFLLLVIIFSFSLIINSYFSKDFHDNSIIFIDGYFNYNNMFKNRIDFIDIIRKLKEKKISLLNKNLCIVLKDKELYFYSKKKYNSYMIPIINNGNINPEGLECILKSKYWLEELLESNNCILSSIKLAFFYKSVLYIIKK